VAHLESLRRTAVGSFRIEDAATLASLTGPEAAERLPLLTVRDALGGYATFAASTEGLALLRRGQQHPLSRLPSPRRAGETALLVDGSGQVAAVIEARAESGWRLVRLLATP
jgi:tRNA U55 pseudouridine synthase TruB